MEYRVLEHIRDLEEAFTLEITIWGLNPRDAVPVSLLRALLHSGGVLMGAYDGQRLVGITLAFPARSADRWVLWSHMTGVDRDYQGQGVGFDLKRRQREWALANGFDEIRWTFDPLQRGNANFNLHILGATAKQYYVNFYGEMVDEINHADIPSDRLEGVWRLRDPRVEQRISAAPPDESSPDRPFLLTDQGLPSPALLDEAEPKVLVQIPRSLTALPGSVTLIQWRMALRQALSSAFERGYVTVDFTSANAYLLQRL